MMPPGRPAVKRALIPLGAFLLGVAMMAGAYFGLLTWAQGWGSAASLFLFNRWYVIPIWLAFGIQAAIYSILRFRLFVPITPIKGATTGPAGVKAPVTGVMGTSGGTSIAAMVACCLHHVTDVLPILGVSAAAAFLTRYQRPFMLVGLGMNLAGILVMLFILYRERRRLGSVPQFRPGLEIE
jgi:hypothetical protein